MPLEIKIPAAEFFDDEKQEFIYTKEQTLRLEHSLVSLSKWESKWCKPFLTKDEKTFEESIDYIKCMTLTQNVDPEVYNRLTYENIEKVNKYIESPMTATYISEEENSRGAGEQITSELIYYWMTAFNIPSEYQKWHLNRLLTLVRVCERKNKPPKKRSKRELMKRNSDLNAARRKKLNTRG